MLDLKNGNVDTLITELRMPSIKQEAVPYSSNWDDNNSIDGSPIDWNDHFQLIHFESSEFMTEVAEIEQLDGYSALCGSSLLGDHPASPNFLIRNHDCMWSGTCGDQSHPGKFGGCGANHGAATPQQQQQEAAFNTVTAVAAASLNSQKTAILTPSNSANIITPKINSAKAAQIPAGRSLLINPRVKQQQQVSRVPTVSTADFLRERETTMNMHVRPDTPLSLDEDPPEFKHNIDLATCTIGSNRLSLTGSRHGYGSRHHHNSLDDASSSRIINMLKEQLEDTESGSLRPYMTSSSGEIGSLTDLLHDLEEIEGDDGDEELDSDTDSNSSRSSKGGGISGGYTHAHHQDNSSSSSSSSSSSYEYQGTHVGDHSYTLPKKRYNLNELGVQTPSDSEEEIDVVSIGEKNLPTNPTPRDCRALQSHVADKIARKQANGGSSQHKHHRRRHSDDEGGYQRHQHYSGAGPSSGSGYHRSPSKYGLSPNYLTPASSTSISGTNTPLPLSSSNPRKRPNKDDRKNRHGNSVHRSNKKQRSIPSGSKKSSPSSSSNIPSNVASGLGPAAATESSEEQETLEKRNLHNDMERQRRIGLKNLFEELKRQIPNLREKERAPKVNILREAANLCNRLNREQEQLNALRKQQQRLYARVRQLRTSLHSQRRTMD